MFYKIWLNYDNMKRIYSFLGLFLLFVTTCEQTKYYSKRQMIEDVDTLFSTIEKVHVDMYANYPKQKLKKDINNLKIGFKHSADIFYFYKQVTPLVVKIGDGHTGISFPYASLKSVSNIQLFPFPVKITYPSKSIIVQKDYTQRQNTIPIGAQITSINNRKSEKIISEMMKYVSGEKEFYKTARLEYLFIPLLFILYKDSVFHINYIFNNKKYSIKISGIPYDERYESPSKKKNSATFKPYSFTIVPDKKIGVIDCQ